MPSTAILADGLWLCLRPSFAGFSQNLRNLVPGTSWASPGTRSGQLFSTKNKPGRSNINELSNSDDDTLAAKIRPSRQRGLSSSVKRSGGHGEDLTAPIKIPTDIRRAPTTALENKLWSEASKPDMQQTLQLLNELISNRNIEPASRHYRVLIAANVDSQRGSPEQVQNILEEMERNDMPMDSATLHAALKVKNSIAVVLAKLI